MYSIFVCVFIFAQKKPANISTFTVHLIFKSQLLRVDLEIYHCSIPLQAIQNDRNNAKAWFRRGKAQIGLKNYKGAMEDFEAALKREPENKG